MHVCLAPQPIYYPDQLAVESVARSTLFSLDIGMLKLNYPAIWGLHVCDVPLAVVIELDNFLPIFGKLVLPVAMPWGFILRWCNSKCVKSGRL